MPRGTLFQVNPNARSYSGGPVKRMIAEVKRYLDEMREELARLTDEQREELARRTEGLPMPVPPPAKPPQWTVKETSKTFTVAGRSARLYEIYRDGGLYEERWIASGFDFGKDLEYPQYARWSRELESAFTAGMGGSSPSGKEIEALYTRGIEMKSVLLGDKIRVVAEVTRLEKKDVSDSTFTVPADYLLKGAQVSGRVPGTGFTRVSRIHRAAIRFLEPFPSTVPAS